MHSYCTPLFLYKMFFYMWGSLLSSRQQKFFPFRVQNAICYLFYFISFSPQISSTFCYVLRLQYLELFVAVLSLSLVITYSLILNITNIYHWIEFTLQSRVFPFFMIVIKFFYVLGPFFFYCMHKAFRCF